MSNACTITDSSSQLTVSLTGELDHHSAKDLCRQIDDAIYASGAKQVILDLSQVHFMDSAGLGLILGRYRRICDLECSLTLRDPNAQVMKILQLAGISRIIPIEQTASQS